MIAILGMACVVSGYFFSFHYMSEQAFIMMSEDIDILKAVFVRHSTIENGFQGIFESYALNDSIKIMISTDRYVVEMPYYITRMY